MTYNVLGNRYFGKGENSVGDRDWMLMMEVIRNEQPDILVIQEAPTAASPQNEVRKKWLHAVQTAGNFSFGPFLDNKQSTVNVFSKYSMNNIKWVTNDRKNQDFPNLRQVFIATLPDLNNLTFVGFHGERPNKSPLRDLSDLKTALDQAQYTQSKTIPFIWAGDFNRELSTIPEARYYAGVHQVKTCCDTNPTKKMKLAYDFIISQSINQIDNRVIKSATGSDHFPVVAKFIVNNKMLQ